MRERENILNVAALRPDYMGFIFYAKSARYAGEMLWPKWVHEVNALGIKTVGVFVSESYDTVMREVEKFGFPIVQLHGAETPGLCQQLSANGLQVWKVFHLHTNDETTWQPMLPYVDACDAFLFDTPSPAYGGTGEKFGWGILEHYPYTKPFMLSGGIGPDDTALVNRLHVPHLMGVDVNSRFEIEPGLKNVESLRVFKDTLRKADV